MIMAIITILTSRIYCQDKIQDLVGIIYADLEVLPWNLANEHFRKLLNAFKIQQYSTNPQYYLVSYFLKKVSPLYQHFLA